MNSERRRAGNPWVIILILSLIVITASVFFMVIAERTFDVTMENTGSSLTLESLDETVSVAMRFLISRPFWAEILLGAFGLFCAWGLKNGESFAWKLGLFWGAMMIVSGTIIAYYEVVVLGWSMVCMLPICHFVVGGIALACLLRVKKEFT